MFIPYFFSVQGCFSLNANQDSDQVILWNFKWLTTLGGLVTEVPSEVSPRASHPSVLLPLALVPDLVVLAKTLQNCQHIHFSAPRDDWLTPVRSFMYLIEVVLFMT